jgi:diaminopimelate decarboxylase
MSLELPQHAPHPFFGVSEDELSVGGRSIVEIAAQAGRTPFYAYSRDAIGARIELLRKTLPREIHLHYAIKANPMPAVVQYIAPLVDGLDVASGREMQIALDAGIGFALIA